MYDVSLDSIYEAEAFPRCIRDPDSSFSVAWDVSSVVLLLYVAGAVPIRVCFDVNVGPDNPVFWCGPACERQARAKRVNRVTSGDRVQRVTGAKRASP